MVDNRDELIKYFFNILWKATDGKIISVTFNKNPLFTAIFNLNDETSKTLNLDAPKAKNLIKEFSNSLTEIGIQESAQNSSFDIEKDNETQALETNTQKSRQHTDTLSDEYSNTNEENDELNFDAALTLMHEAKKTTTKKDERFNKANDEQVTSNMTEDSSLQSINKALDQSLVTNNIQENTSNENSSSNKKAKERIEYTLSELSDADPDKSQASGWLQNSNKMMNFLQTSNDLEEIEYEHTNTNQIKNQTLTFINNPSKKTNSNIINAETSINILLISSIINNQQEISTSNINKQNLSDELMDYQHTYKKANDTRQYSIVLIESVDINSLRTSFMEQPNNSLPATMKNSTESLHINNQDNRKSNKRKYKNLLNLSSNKKRMQYSSPKAVSEEGSTAYSKRLKPPSDYTGRLNILRKIKGISDSFASNTNNLVGITFNYEINTWKIVKKRSLTIKQQEEMSPIVLEKTTDNWKDNDLKAQINKKFGNNNSHSILRKWIAC
ncbi:31742_t:CDS:10 [Racocetra persica]|uniref:31742_t:CDS:1 n=1 Tax=Racocetra persica TaxID=160502 RepID=A0ACA9LEF6_9GLOM|nr:31742_t:CDS:10 [Racocetra persica]